MNLRDQILNAQDRELVPVPVPEWGCTVYLRPLSGADQQAIYKAHISGNVSYGPTLIPALCDADGKPLFTQADVNALEGKRAAVLDRLLNRVGEINAIGPEALDEKKDPSAGIPSGG